jgi:hypothetical protein
MRASRRTLPGTGLAPARRAWLDDVMQEALAVVCRAAERLRVQGDRSGQHRMA